jgi:RNA polymerase sigma factor (sigma-70 family)
LAAVNAVGRAAGLEALEPLEDARARDLYERHARRVLAYCRSRLRRPEDAEDAVQTTFLHAVRNLRRGDRPAHELAWLLGIARNVCLSRLETAGRRARLELVCDPVDLERSEAPSGRRDELIGLEDALARLPEQQRRAVLLRDWRGLSYAEVAAELGVSLANAETLIFRGRRDLAALLREQPAATRRRLASLGNAGSLLAWVKAGLGGAAGAKAAAAIAVVAVSGAGLAAGTGALSGDSRPAPPSSRPADVRPLPAATPAPAPESVRPAPTRSGPEAAAPATAPRATSATPAPAAPDSASGTAPQAPSGGPAATPPAARASAPPPAALPAAPEPAKAVPAAKTAVTSAVAEVSETVERAVPVLEPVLEPVTETVVAAVETLPPLPVELPPAVEQAVDTLPPVTVPPPASLPVGPVELDPRKLLP